MIQCSKMHCKNSFEFDESLIGTGMETLCEICRKSLVTIGNYADEKAACDAFDAAVDDQYWWVRKEAWGKIVNLDPHPLTQEKTKNRIDRVMIPKKKCVDEGWTLGVVGVEIKKSGVPLGPVASQMLDYRRCVWNVESPGSPGLFIPIVLSKVFLFPVFGCGGGPFSSVMAQQRIGFARIEDSRYRPYAKGGLILSCANQDIFTPSQGPRIPGAQKSGFKQGSR